MASPPPAMHSPEYLAEDISGRLLSTCIAFIVLETLFICLMYASRFLAHDQKINLTMAILMTAGYLVCMGKISVGILMVEIGGSGRHRSTLPAHTLQNALKLSTASQIVCPLSASMSKLGILALYYQLFGQTSKNYRIAIRATFVLVTCVMLVQFIVPFANCKPFSKMWTPDGPGTCAIASLSLWRYLSLPNVFTTVIMIAIPFPKLFGLKISAATKLGLAVILCVCVAGMVAAIMRVVSFLAVTSFHDITFENVKPFCWTITESGIYLIAGILPTLRPLMKKVFKNVPFDKILSASFRSSGSWGHKKGVFNKDKTLPELPKGQKPFTDMSSKGTVLVMMDDERYLMREDSR